MVHERLPNALRRRLVHEEVAGVGLGVRIPGDDLDPLLTSLAEHARDAGTIFHGHGDDIHAARDPGIDDFVLLGRIGLGRPVPDQVHAQLRGRLVRALAAGFEIGVAQALGHHGQRDTATVGRAIAGTERMRGCRLLPQGPHQVPVAGGHDERGHEDDDADHGHLRVLHVEFLGISSGWLQCRPEGGATGQPPVQGDRGQQQASYQDAGQGGRQIRQAETILKHGDGKKSEQRTLNASAAAEDRRPAHHDGGDRQQLIAGAGVGLRLPQVRHINDGRQARDQAREDIDERHPALDRDAGMAGAFGREADGKERRQQLRSKK